MQVQNHNQMGKVFTNLTIINNADQILAEAGFLAVEQIRSVTLDNVLVDTGATTLCLPADVIARVGFESIKRS